MSPSARRTFGWILFSLFAVAMLMGPGPGLMLVNRPVTTPWGLPLVYAWGIGWFLVQVFVVVAAYLFVWRDGEDNQ